MAGGDGDPRAAQAGDYIVTRYVLRRLRFDRDPQHQRFTPRQRTSVRTVDQAVFAASRCLKRPARLEPSHSGDVTSQGGSILSTRLSRRPLLMGGDQLAPPGASNSNLNIAKLHLPHQHMPTGRLPGRHQPHFRPLVSLLVKPQAHEIERRWRRSSFDCGGPERRASPRRLKLPLHGHMPKPPCASHTRNSFRASRPQGRPSRVSAQQRRQPGRPGLNWVFLAASRNAAGAVLRPP